MCEFKEFNFVVMADGFRFHGGSEQRAEKGFDSR